MIYYVKYAMTYFVSKIISLSFVVIVNVFKPPCQSCTSTSVLWPQYRTSAAYGNLRMLGCLRIVPTIYIKITLQEQVWY